MRRNLRQLLIAGLGVPTLLVLAWAVLIAWSNRLDEQFQERCQQLRPGLTPDEARAAMPQPTAGGMRLGWSSNGLSLACRRYTCELDFEAGRLTGASVTEQGWGCK